MKENQAKAEEKWDEAAQHPGSEVKRVVFSRGKADGIESKGEGEAQRGDHNSPAKQSFAGFRLRTGQSFFCESDGFLVAHVTQESEKAKDDGKGGDDTKAGEDIVHAISFRK